MFINLKKDYNRVWKEAWIMEINEDALKNFQNSKFDFVDAKGNDVDFSNLSDDVKYTRLPRKLKS